MAIAKEKLAAIISGRAKEMCSPEADKKFNALAGKMNLSESFDPDPDPSSYDGDADRLDSMYLSSPSMKQTSRDIMYNQNSALNSSMPDAIKESMLNKRIDTSSLGNTSVLDSLNLKAQPKRSMVQEQRSVSQPSGVDYSIIKAIVNECLSEYFSKMPLNENAGSLKTIGIKNGTISLIDNKGNVFQAKLEKIKNNDKKQ